MFSRLNILERIFATKMEEIEGAKRRVSIDQLKDEAHSRPLLPFKSTLASSHHPIALIAEVKKASPSRGLIREDFDAIGIAMAYKGAGADCLSVLTDVPYFQGSPDFLKEIKPQVQIPCLRKDFICDPYQVYEARAWGADAVLLIAASLDKSQISDLRDQIEELGMDAFLEVHDEAEAEMACELNFSLIGVNNRNLRDFKTDFATSERIIPILRKSIPSSVIVSESALETNSDVERARLAGARAVLIGTTFCASPDIGAKVSEVMGW